MSQECRPRSVPDCDARPRAYLVRWLPVRARSSASSLVALLSAASWRPVVPARVHRWVQHALVEVVVLESQASIGQRGKKVSGNGD